MSTKNKKIFKLKNIIGIIIAVIAVIALVWILNPSNEIKTEDSLIETTEESLEEVSETITEDEETIPECITDSDCGLYYICSSLGECLKKADSTTSSSDSSSSSSSSSSDSGSSSSESSTTVSVIGESCTSNSECELGSTCNDGICEVVSEDTQVCVDNSDCGEYLCDSETRTCYDSCTSNDECQADYVCNTEINVCNFACTSNSDCSSDSACDTENSVCVACSETDSGQDYLNLGTSIGSFESIYTMSASDECNSRGHLIEYYCSASETNIQLNSEEISCEDEYGSEYVCSEGACVTYTCVDSDCDEGYTCDTTNNVCYESCTSSDECSSDAACVTDPFDPSYNQCVVCTDPDDGEDFLTYGLATGVNSWGYLMEIEDSCRSSSLWEIACVAQDGHDYITEIDEGLCSDLYDSSYSCVDGACESSTAMAAPGTQESFIKRFFDWVFYRS